MAEERVMTSTVRPRAAGLLSVLGVVLALSGSGLARQDVQALPAPALDRALAAGNLDEARRLVPHDWAASEQLFVSYLERAFLSSDPLPPDADARARADRLAEVFFRIVEYDFAQAVVSALDGADLEKRRALIGATRDYFVALERLRATSSQPAAPAGGPTPTITSERAKLGPQFYDIADRFRALGVRHAEFHTLRTMNNLGAGLGPDGLSSQARADRLADELGDDLSLVFKRPFTEASLALAERLGLPGRQRLMLEALAGALSGTTEPSKLEQAARYLERAREIERRLPPLETVNYWLYPSAAPISARSILPALWSVYLKLKRPAEAQPLLAEAIAVSQPFGVRAVISTLGAFASRARGLDSTAEEAVLEASRPVLALALTIDDPRERAITLEWYSRHRLNLATSAAPNAPSSESAARLRQPFPPAYDQLLQLCLESSEVALTADALANQAAFQVATEDRPLAAATFAAAVRHAEQAGDFAKAAQVANRATQSYGGASLSRTERFEFATRAIAAAQKAGNDLELAQAFRFRSQAWLGATHQSLDDLQQALAAAERYTAQSGSSAEEGICLYYLAVEHELRAEYRVAAELWRRRAKNTTGQVESYERLARLYSTKMGEPSLALEAADQLRQNLERSLPGPERQPGAATVADAYARLARVAMDLGRPSAALEYFDIALQKWTESPALNAPSSRRSILSRRADLYTSLGDFDAALRDWNEVLSLTAQTRGRSQASHAYSKATVLAQMAHVHALAGDSDQALREAREAIGLLERNTSSGAWFGRPVLVLPDILLRTGHADEAVAFLELSRDRSLAESLETPVAKRFHLEALANAHARAGHYDEARSLLRSAVEIDRGHPTGEIGGLGASLLALGKLEAAAGNSRTAAEHLAAAREVANPYDLDRIWQIERALGVALLGEGNTSQAELHLERALASLESVRERLRPEEFRLKYGFDRSDVYDDHAGLLAARAARSGKPADAARAFQAAERKRTQTLWSLLATGWSRLPPDAVPEQLQRVFELDTRITAKRALLREQSEVEAGQRDAAQIERLQADLRQVHADHARLLTSLAQGQYRYAAPTALAASLATPVRAALGSSRALIEYLVLDDRSYAFVMVPSGITVVPLAVGRARLREQVAHLLQPFKQLRTGEVDLARLTYDTRAAYALYQAIFAPVQSALGSTSDLLIVPDDVLIGLPFDMLIDQAPGRLDRSVVLHGELADLRFLVRRFTIGYLTSSAQLLSPATSRQSAVAPKQLFAMANPAGSRPAPTSGYEDPLRRQLRSGSLSAMLTSVPGADTEVQRIARHFTSDKTTVITGASATEAAYKAQAGQYRILHFATHGVPSDSQPFYSTLVLAPDSATGEDGFLQAYEVLRTPLAADLVVLSACETAVGSSNEGQGLTGLVAAFEQAGARSVLATSWSIDEAASDVMDTFYRALAGGAPAPAALRQAKLDLLGRRIQVAGVQVSLAHPFFWAPFKLVGAPAGR